MHRRERGQVLTTRPCCRDALFGGYRGTGRPPQRGRQDRHKTGAAAWNKEAHPMTHLIALPRPLQAVNHSTVISLPAVTAYPQTQGSSVALAVALRYLATRR